MRQCASGRALLGLGWGWALLLRLHQGSRTCSPLLPPLLLPLPPLPQLLDNPVMEARFVLLHRLLSVGVAGLLPMGGGAEGGSSPLFGGRRRQCAAALHTLRIALGWLLPTYLLLRCSCRRENDDDDDDNGGAARGGSGNGSGDGMDGAEGEAERGDDDDGSGARRGCAAARWVLEHVFLEGNPLRLMRVQAWLVLCCFCWLAALLVAAWGPT